MSVANTTDDCSRRELNDHALEPMAANSIEKTAPAVSDNPQPSTSKQALDKNDGERAKDDELAFAHGVNPASSIRVQVELSLSMDFSHVIVYLSAYQLSDGNVAAIKGVFKVFAFEELAVDYPLTDFELEKGMYKNRWRTTVKPVSVKCKDNKYVEASLFCRIRRGAQMELVLAIAGRLTRQLDVYKDHIRDGIAEEWCAQEHWRIFPRFPGQMHKIKPIGDGRPDLREIMRDLLPEGFDTEWPM